MKMKVTEEKDLLTLIEGKVRENIHLEYKDKRALDDNSKIAKSISAMANSDGGIIIYGLCDNDKDQAPDEIDWIKDPKKEEKIHQVVNSRISPQIEGIKTILIENTKNKNEFVIIVDVPKSEIAPHQDSMNKDEKRFWRRRGSIITQMDFCEIEDLFFKRKRPKLEIVLKRLKTRKPAYDILIYNKGKVSGKNVLVKLLIPFPFEINDAKWSRGLNKYHEMKGRYSEYQYFEKDVPVFPVLPFDAGKIFHSKEVCVKNLTIGFLIVCDDMEIKQGEILLGDFGESKVNYIDNQEIGIPIPCCELLDSYYTPAEFCS